MKNNSPRASLTLRSEPDAPARTLSIEDVKEWKEIERLLIQEYAKHVGDPSVNARLNACTNLSAQTTMDALSSIEVVEVFSTAYDGCLDHCSLLLDLHYRLLALTLLENNTHAVKDTYETFVNLPPRLRKSSLRATAAIAEAGLIYKREERSW